MLRYRCETCEIPDDKGCNDIEWMLEIYNLRASIYAIAESRFLDIHTSKGFDSLDFLILHHDHEISIVDGHGEKIREISPGARPRKSNGAAFVRHIRGDRAVIVIETLDISLPGETIYPVRVDGGTIKLDPIRSIDVTGHAVGSIDRLIAGDLCYGVREVTGDLLYPWFQVETTMDPDTADLLERHRLMLARCTSLDDPGKIELEDKIRVRLGSFRDSSMDRLVHTIIMQELDREHPEPRQPLTLEDRDRLRARARERLEELRRRPRPAKIVVGFDQIDDGTRRYAVTIWPLDPLDDGTQTTHARDLLEAAIGSQGIEIKH